MNKCFGREMKSINEKDAEREGWRKEQYRRNPGGF
jgi:hypothetical protein